MNKTTAKTNTIRELSFDECRYVSGGVLIDSFDTFLTPEIRVRSMDRASSLLAQYAINGN